MNILKNRNYYIQKSQIDKRNNQKTAYVIQEYANNVVDNYIIDYNRGLNQRPDPNVMFGQLAIMNKPAVYSNYQRLLNSPYFDTNAFDRIMIKNHANKNLEQICEKELERMVKNLDFVEANLRSMGIPVKTYKDLINEKPNPVVANRGQIIREIQKRKLEASEIYGVNIPDYSFTYRNIDLLAESLLRQSQMTSSYEKAILTNRMAEARGLPPVYTKKKWIWTGRGKTTRHESNNMQERDLEENFVVINDKTLDIDLMMYPCDPSGGPSNSYICYCECEYYGDGDEIIGGVNGLTPTRFKEPARKVTFARNLTTNLNTIEDTDIKPIKYGEDDLSDIHIKNMNAFAVKHKDSDVEHMIWLDKKGNVIFEHTDNKAHSVNWRNGDEMVAGKKQPEYDFFIDHNHPYPYRQSDELDLNRDVLNSIGTYLSNDDTRQLFKIHETNDGEYVTKFKGVSVEYHNKFRMVIQRVEGSSKENPVIEDFLNSGKSPNNYHKSYSELQDAFNESYSYVQSQYREYLKDIEVELPKHMDKWSAGRKYTTKEYHEEENRWITEYSRGDNRFNKSIEEANEELDYIGFNISVEWF